MRELTSISKIFKILIILNICFLLIPQHGAYSQTVAEEDEGGTHSLSSPFAEFGEFSANEDEESDERFFQAGRFFGVGIGAGLTAPIGNAGRLYKPAFPAIDFRLNYWFDFFVALQLDVRNSVHLYDAAPDGKTNTNLFRLLGQVKYYFDTKDLSAPLTFIGPHVIVGCGMYRRTDNFQTQGSSESASAFGLNFGAGVELTIKPKKFYFNIETIANMVTFRDAFDTKFSDADPVNGVPDRTGLWIDTVGSFTWTW